MQRPEEVLILTLQSLRQFDHEVGDQVIENMSVAVTVGSIQHLLIALTVSNNQLPPSVACGLDNQLVQVILHPAHLFSPIHF